MDGGYQNAGERQTVEVLNEIEDELRLSARPSVRQDLSITNICGDDNETREKAAHLRQPVRLFQGARADDDSLRTIIEIALNQVSAADSATYLHFYICRRQDRLDFSGVVATRCNTIEIDYMQVAKSILPPRQCNSYRIRNPDKLLVVRVGYQLNAGTTAEIKRGNCDHRV